MYLCKEMRSLSQRLNGRLYSFFQIFLRIVLKISSKLAETSYRASLIVFVQWHTEKCIFWSSYYKQYPTIYFSNRSGECLLRVTH
jgi:hypothetical protein